MALTAQNIMDRASLLLQDVVAVRWTAAELLNWVNDGRRELGKIRPDVYSESGTVTLVDGAKQSVPADGLRLLDVPCNVNGPSVSVTQRGWLDQQFPAWRQGTPSSTVKHFMLDERYPSQFWVYPPAIAGGAVEVIYQPGHVNVSSSTALSAYEEPYGAALVDYVCYRAFSKDAEYAGNAQRALAHKAQFDASLKDGGLVGAAVSPNVQNTGGSKRLPAAG